MRLCSAVFFVLRKTYGTAPRQKEYASTLADSSANEKTRPPCDSRRRIMLVMRGWPPLPHPPPTADRFACRFRLNSLVLRNVWVRKGKALVDPVAERERERAGAERLIAFARRKAAQRPEARALHVRLVEVRA